MPREGALSGHEPTGQDGSGAADPSDLDVLLSATRRLTARVSSALLDHGLTLDQWRVLAALADHGPQTMSQLAARTDITGPTLSRVVDRLVEAALVYRNTDAADRRRVVVHASQRGRATRHRLARQVADAERSGLRGLPEVHRQRLRALLLTPPEVGAE